MVTTISDPYNIGDYGGALSAGAGGTIANSDPYNIGIPSSVLSAGATAPNIFQQPSGLGAIAGGIGDIFGGLMGAGQQVLSSPNALMGLAGGLLTKEAYDRLSDIGEQAKREAMGIAERGQMESEFRPFTVTTPTGAMFTARMGGQPTTQPSGGFLGSLQPVSGPALPSPPMMQLPPIEGGVSPLVSSGLRQLKSRGDQLLESLPQMIQTDPALKSQYDSLFQDSLKSYQASPMTPEGGAEFAAGRDAMQQLKRSIMDQERLGIAPGEVPTPGRVTSYMPPRLPQPTADGLQIGMELSPEERALQQQLLGGAGTFFGQAAQPTVDREQAIFERIRAAQRPEEERQRLALEERLAAQGRLGTSSAAFGGATPELLALSTAEREARDRSMLTAMQQAQAEQAQQAALGGQFLGAGYLPTQQLVAATQPGLIQQELAQQAQQFGTGLFGETALSGIEAQLLSEQARANLLGGIGSNVISGLINQQRAASAAPSGGGSSLGGLFSTIAGGLGNIGGGIKDLLGI
jgi:hypothetical protein